MVVVIVVSKLVISALQIALAKIKGNEDIEWKFAKTSLIISYLNAHDVLPPPFNLLPCSKYQASRSAAEHVENVSFFTVPSLKTSVPERIVFERDQHTDATLSH